MTGSHIDSQPSGGKFDGAYGVLAGLEVVRTLNDYNYETNAPIEVAVWTNEEGSRFAPAMVASGVFAGVFDGNLLPLDRWGDCGNITIPPREGMDGLVTHDFDGSIWAESSWSIAAASSGGPSTDD